MLFGRFRTWGKLGRQRCGSFLLGRAEYTTTGVKATQIIRTSSAGAGSKGSKGERGATLRGPQIWTDCADGYAFESGSPGDKWIDLVMYNDNCYVCKRNHTKSAATFPGGPMGAAYWQLGDNVALAATKILLAQYALVKNLGVEAIEMKDASGNVIFTAKDGNVICKEGVFENVTISGRLEGVTGSFKRLVCTNDAGEIVGGLEFDTADKRLWLNGDLYHQGYNSQEGRLHRFEAGQMFVRESFGANSFTTLVVYGTYGYYYTKGTGNEGVRVDFSAAVYKGTTVFYKIPLVGTSGDAKGFPVDTVIFNRDTNSVMNYELVGSNSQRVLLINANDRMNNVAIFSNGKTEVLNGGTVRQAVQIKPALLIPTPPDATPGAGPSIWPRTG